MKAKGSAKPQEDKEYSGGGTKETKEDTLEEKPVPTPLAEKDQEKDQRIADLTESLQRLQAEFENFMKRNKKDAELLRKYAEEDFIRKLLPIIDSFEHGLKECKEETEFAKGMKMMYSQFQRFLKQSGVAPIEAAGKFDPHLHEVMLQQESDEEGGTILQELQKGYKIYDHILRHSKVKISKGRPQEAGKETAQKQQ